MATKQQELQQMRLFALQQKNLAKLRQLIGYLVNQIVFLEGKKGKGKSLGAVGITKNMKELFNKPVVVIGTKMGLNENFGDYTYLDEKQFIAELEKVSAVSKDTTDTDLGEAVDAALKKLGVDIMNAILIFDEAYKFFDARTPSDKLVRVFGYFVAQSRHYNITMILIAPNRDMIDKRVRRQIDWFGRASTTCKSLPNPETGQLECIRPGCPHTTTVRFIGGIEKFRLRFYGPTYWNMYNSTQVVGFRDSSLKIGSY